LNSNLELDVVHLAASLSRTGANRIHCIETVAITENLLGPVVRPATAHLRLVA